MLVVDDDATLRRTLGLNLRARGYTADLAGTGEAALQMAASHHPDVVILDLGLPGLKRTRSDLRPPGRLSVPIVVLSGRDAESMKVKALDLGADDYLTKPFGMDELFARIRAATRRAVVPEGDPVVTTPDFTIDFAAKRVLRDGELVRLTPLQWRIVEVLVRNRGRLVTYSELLHDVWGPGLRHRDQLPARLHDPHPATPRARARQTPLLHHRTRDGLPVPAP